MRGINNGLCDVYLDNAATSFPKPKTVVDELYRCVKRYCGNPGRSGHRMSLAAADKIYEAREAISEFFGADGPEKVCFTQNATAALNTVIKGLIKEKCHVIVSDAEHNSTLRPLHRLREELSLDVSRFDSDKPLTEAITPLINGETRFIICNLVSNVTGKEINLNELKEIANRNGITLILDASQMAGHKSIDIGEINNGAISCAGHKALFGIQGSGFFILFKNTLPSTIFEGGSGSDSFNREMPLLPPERYEAGTLSCPAIATLLEGIKFINSVGISDIEKKLGNLTERLSERLKALDGITVYGAENGILAFNFDEINSFEGAKLLSDKGIALRGGFHCAPDVHKKLNTEKIGAIRVSFSYFNSLTDVDKLYKAVREII